MPQETLNFTNLPPPNQFSFLKQEWPQWYQRYKRFSLLSGIDSQPDQVQVNSLLLFMGQKSEDIFDSFGLSSEDSAKFKVVLKKFEDYFVHSQNVIYERAMFNRRIQKEDEPILDFITDLHKLAKTCDFGTLKDNFIRDRIVVGIRDEKLSEIMQLDNKLTLDKATKLCKQHEEVKRQQNELRDNLIDENLTNINQIKRKIENRTTSQSNKTKQCFWCGSKEIHGKDNCPARNKSCNKCKKEVIFRMSAEIKIFKKLKANRIKTRIKIQISLLAVYQVKRCRGKLKYLLTT